MKMVPPQIRITDDDLAKHAFDEYAVAQCIVDPAGIPREAQCVAASGAVFARAAVTAIGHSRFSPAPKGGQTVAMKMETRISCHISLSGPTSPGALTDDRRTHYAEETSSYSSASDPFDRGTSQQQ